jgi:S1-C subfamily serine protease
MTLSLTQRFVFPVFSLLAVASTSSCIQADELGQAVRAAVQSADASVVRLRVIGGEQSVDGDKVSSLVTTGVVISDAGEILTSEFALQGKPEAILAEDITGKRTNVEVVATDHLRRLVLLKAKEGKWTPVRPASSQSTRIGQWSIALGRFYAAESSNVSVGIVSALHRIHGLAIQSDAKISPVNYGGPLIDLQGQAMGILVPLSPRGQGSSSSGVEWYDSGIGFAIPMDDALRSAERLKAGRDLKAGKLGVKLAAAGVFSSRIRIERVIPKGPAEAAGLRKDDVLVSVNDWIIERMSILEEAVASSYAGDSLQIAIKRGDENLSFAVTLAEELPVANPGYIGLLTTRVAKKTTDDHGPAPAEVAKLLQNLPLEPKPPAEQKPDEGKTDEKSDAVPLLVINETSAAKSGLPQRVELMKINGTATPDSGELFTALADFQAGDELSIDYRIPGQPDLKSTEITTETRPENVTRLSAELLKEISVVSQENIAKMKTDDGASKEAPSNDARTPDQSSTDQVERRELSFDERGQAIVFGSSSPSGILPGIVILLSADQESEDQILTRWKPFLDSHKLMVAIPVNPEKSRLTSDDIPLVMTMIQSLAGRSKADLRRIVVVGNREQAQVAWQLIFGGPSPIRGIALNNGWISAAEASTVDGADKSVLLLDQPTNNQALALMSQCQEALRKSGFWAARPTDSETERTIADWSVLLRSF